MIVWAGQNGSSCLNDGARYNPVADSWIPTTLTGAPGPRNVHAAVWAANQMITWGGSSNTYLGAADGDLNDTYSYTMTLSPVQQLTSLISLVQTFNFTQGIENSLDAKLENAKAALESAKSGYLTSTCALLEGFINEVQAQSDKKISSSQADQLIAAANNIETAIGCP
jgi:hypothetical protein